MGAGFCSIYCEIHYIKVWVPIWKNYVLNWDFDSKSEKLNCGFFPLSLRTWGKNTTKQLSPSKIVQHRKYNYFFPKFRLNPSWMAVLVTSLHCNVDHPKFHTLQSMVSHCQIIHIFPPNQKRLPNQSLQKTTLVMKKLWQKMMLIYVLLGMLWLISCFSGFFKNVYFWPFWE